ncbi:MAG: hypothetical protein AAF573_22640 [Bacteroidota bacterium]
MKKLNLLFTCSFLLLWSVSQSQDGHNFFLQTKVGGAICQSRYNNTFTNHSINFREQFNMGINLVGGLGYLYAPNKRIAFGGGILYEFATFSSSLVEEFDGQIYAIQTHEFKSQSLLLPIKIHLFHQRRFSFSLGVLGVYHLRSEINGQNIGDYYNEIRSHHHHAAPVFDTPQITTLDQRANAQYTLGCHYRLSALLLLDVELRDYLSANHLHSKYGEISPFSGTLSFGLSWNFIK